MPRLWKILLRSGRNISPGGPVNTDAMEGPARGMCCHRLKEMGGSKAANEIDAVGSVSFMQLGHDMMVTMLRRARIA